MLIPILITAAVLVVMTTIAVVCYQVDRHCSKQVPELSDEFWENGYHTKIPGYSLNEVEPGPIPYSAALVAAVKDVPNLKKTIDRWREIGSAFTKFDVYLYENDSTDQQTLDAVQAEGGKCDRWTEDEKKLSRFPRMQLVRHRMKARYDGDHDFVIVADLDLLGGLHKNSLCALFSDPVKWDGVFANGMGYHRKNSPFYFYYKALKLHTVNYDPCAYEPYEGGFSRRAFNTKQIDMRRDIRVNSAFNGVAVYSREAFAAGDYMYYKDDKKCEHCIFHDSMRAAGFDRFYMSKRMLVYR